MYLIQTQEFAFIDADKVVSVFIDKSGVWTLKTVTGMTNQIDEDYVHSAINHLNAHNQNITTIREPE